jgi:hypothetical protein
LPVLALFFREYRRYFPDFSFLIIGLPFPRERPSQSTLENGRERPHVGAKSEHLKDTSDASPQLETVESLPQRNGIVANVPNSHDNETG